MSKKVLQFAAVKTDEYSTKLILLLEDGTLWEQYYEHGSVTAEGWHLVPLPKEETNAPVGLS